MATIGKVSDLTRESYFEWRIKEFFSLPEEVDKHYDSPSFSFAGESWCLSICPNGVSEDNSNGSIGVYLNRENSGSSISLAWSFGVKTVDGKKDRVRQHTHTFEEAEGWGFLKFLKRSVLLEKKTELVPSDILTLFCTLILQNDTKSADDAANEKLLKDFANLIDNGEHSDVTISVKDKDFRLHRNILAGRNSYFSSMFKAEMKEKITGAVTIEDCDPCIFQSFINFLYTGKTHTISSDNVCALYEVADKYQEDQLKAQCLSYMKNEICVDSFCDFIALALKHDEKELLKNATEFFCRKTSEIIKSVKWHIFMTEHPTQANELYIKFVELNAK